MALLRRVIMFALLGAAIGAVAGLLTSELMPEGGVAGAIVGALLGMGLGARMDAHRSAADGAVERHLQGTRTVNAARRDLVHSARKDQAISGGVHGGADYTGSDR